MNEPADRRAGAVPDTPYPYAGPEDLREPVQRALHNVVDPEMALSIVDVGLIYGVTIDAGRAHVLVTMTSVACPVTELIVEDIEAELDRVVPREMTIDVELVWEPAWSAARMSAAGKAFMGW
jgi:metal-sulfur cluster biosynthetic enzyme